MLCCSTKRPCNGAWLTNAVSPSNSSWKAAGTCCSTAVEGCRITTLLSGPVGRRPRQLLISPVWSAATAIISRSCAAARARLAALPDIWGRLLPDHSMSNTWRVVEHMHIGGCSVSAEWGGGDLLPGSRWLHAAGSMALTAGSIPESGVHWFWGLSHGIPGHRYCPSICTEDGSEAAHDPACILMDICCGAA